MADEKEVENILRRLSEMTGQEQVLLRDQFRRLSYQYKHERAIDHTLSSMRDLITDSIQYMKTKHVDQMDRLAKQKKIDIERLNEHIDRTIKSIKSIYHNLLGTPVGDTLKEIRKEREKLKLFRDIELHNYQELYEHYTTDENQKKIIAKLIQKCQDELKAEKGIEDAEAHIASALTFYKDVIRKQANLLKLQIDLLNNLKIEEDTAILDDLKPTRAITSTMEALDENYKEFRQSMTDEDQKVFDALQYFMREKRTMEKMFETVFYDTDRENKLGVGDIAKLLSTVNSVDESIKFLRFLFPWYTYFDEAAQKRLDNEIDRYEQMLKGVNKDAQWAFYDKLTGAANKNAFEDAILDLRKIENITVSLIALDIDFFKTFNNVYGHSQGNVVLRQFAKVIAKKSSDGKGLSLPSAW